MSHLTLVGILLLFSLGCTDSGTEPSVGVNLLVNPTFQLNGAPSLHGWIVPDTSVARFSNDVPLFGSGHSIVLRSWGRSPMFSNSIFAMIPANDGTHRYRLSVIGKKRDVVGGLVTVGINLRSAAMARYHGSIVIEDSAWTLYARIDTISTTVQDTLFVVISGSISCTEFGSTHFNTCRFERLD